MSFIGNFSKELLFYHVYFTYMNDNLKRKNKKNTNLNFKNKEK